PAPEAPPDSKEPGPPPDLEEEHPAPPPEPPAAEPGKSPEVEPEPAEPSAPPPAPGSPMALFNDAVARHDTAAALAAARAAADAMRKDKTLAADDRARGLTDLAIRIVREVGSGPEAAAAAEALFQEATDIRRVRFGDESAEVADSLDTLSTFHFMLGRYDTAEDEQRRALSLRENLLPAGDPAIASARDGL